MGEKCPLCGRLHPLRKELNEKGYTGHGAPAADAEQERFCALCQELLEIGVEPDGRHRHDDQEFSGLNKEGRNRRGNRQERIDEGRGEKAEDKPRKDFPEGIAGRRRGFGASRCGGDRLPAFSGRRL